MPLAYSMLSTWPYFTDCYIHLVTIMCIMMTKQISTSLLIVYSKHRLQDY
jgi:hypothetical protein